MSSSKKRSKSQGGEVFTVEKIVGKRIQHGVCQYMIKWEGYPESQNTWENEDNVFCADLIKEYETANAGKELSGSADTDSMKTSVNPKVKKNVIQPGKWENMVQEIINVERSSSNELLCVIKWKDGSTSIHPSAFVNINCPQKVIKFYEDHLKFKEE